MLARDTIEETRFSFSTKTPSPPDRRRDQRHLTILRVGAIIVDGRRELCLIRNISAGGLMIHVYSAFAEGQSVTIELKSNQPIDGRVSWVQDANIGIAFDAAIDVAEMLTNPPRLENGWLPRMPRVEVEGFGTLRAGARTFWVAARDISQGGVKLDLEEGLAPDTPIVLSLDRFRPIHGVVRWSHDGHCGVSFNQIVPFGELIAWLRAQA